MDERPDNSQQLMDILLVMDKEEKTIQAVSGVQDGKLQTKNPLEDNNDLLKVDRHGDMFSNFFSNLWNQIKDPTRFHFFRVPEEEVQRVAADFQQTVKNPTPEGQARMAQYEVQPPRQAQQQSQQQAQPAAGQQQQQTDAPQQQPQPQEQQQQPQYKYDVNKIDWEAAASIGIKREQLEQNGMLDQMLKGFQTDKTARVYFNLGSLSHSNDSQLSLRENTDGKLFICSHGILDLDKMQKQFFGYELSQKDMDAVKLSGNIGHPAEVTNRAGEKIPSLISRNLKTNELVSFPLDKVRIPAEKNGHTFTPDEITKLKQGEAVVCQFQTKAKEGQKPKTYLAPVQFSAAKMQLELLFGERGKLAMDEHREMQKQTANQSQRPSANRNSPRSHSLNSLVAGRSRFPVWWIKEEKTTTVTLHGSPDRNILLSCSRRITRPHSKRGVSSPQSRTRYRWRSIHRVKPTNPPRASKKPCNLHKPSPPGNRSSSKTARSSRKRTRNRNNGRSNRTSPSNARAFAVNPFPPFITIQLSRPQVTGHFLSNH